ncbi:hypothetical protein D3C73_1556980 [compost metagenome]
MERIIHNIIFADVIPYILSRPVRNRIKFDQSEFIIVLYLFGIGAGWRLITANPGNPGIILGKNAGKRLYFADRTALVRIDTP